MESLITTFHIDWKIIIAQVINFGIVFLVLYLFALKPLKKLMTDRAEKIAKGLADANLHAETVKRTQKEYEDALAKAKTEAHELFKRGKREAEAKKAEMIAAAQNEVAMMIASGKKVLETEKVKNIDEAKKEIVSLAVKAAEKILLEKTHLSDIS